MDERVSPEAPVRSPLARGQAYPTISLKTALERANAIASEAGRAPIRLAQAGRLWGYRPKSSGIALTASALKQFCLVVDSGSGEDRVLQITKFFVSINGEDLDENIKRAALAPKVIRERFEQWGSVRRDDPWRIADLRAAYGYSDAAARKFLKVFDHTIAFANLAQYQIGLGGAAVPSTATPTRGGAAVEALKSVRLQAPAVATWPLRRFTYDTEVGTVTCAFPSRLTEDTISKLMVWFITILQQIDRIPQKPAKPSRSSGIKRCNFPSDS